MGGEKLTIGEAARLLGMTPRAIRHYERLGLLEEPKRSAAGYRLYGARELLRLRRIKRLRELGLPLRRIGGLLEGPEDVAGLRPVLETLLGEVESRIRELEERRALILEALSRAEPEEPAGPPLLLRLLEERLGAELDGLDPALLEQGRRLWALLDAFEWPEGYREAQEALATHLAERPEALRELLGLEERLARLAAAPEDSPEVERLAEDFARYWRRHPQPGSPPGWPEAVAKAFSELALSRLSPAQRRCLELVQERLERSG
ncbi:hypothetical protein RxyAA322_23170 [Rubrobacter xylanophilus]|uniref:HTH merR-type domain-containing protein n=1 Tax=Rubrobacter xylanophilus TaxID=49319 RepID=A0A510HNW8_9ACTN|nr:MerR family transcriptional regulator [Rubrobacter xylanophilus]BBL80463.1 hypothetical protein RxyAA322_23170 [Rubrobacter xylanophilus]